MIRCGELCRTCRGTCTEDNKRVSVACPVCDGSGCDACDGGDFEPGCPYEFLRGYYSVIEMAGMTTDGMLPVSGGVMNQSAWFMRFRSQMTHETNLVREEQWSRDSGK